MITKHHLELQRRLSAMDKDLHLAVGYDTLQDSIYIYISHPAKRMDNLHIIRDSNDTDLILSKAEKWLIPKYKKIPKACIELIDNYIYHGEDKKQCKVVSILNKEEFLIFYDGQHANVFIVDCYIKE